MNNIKENPLFSKFDQALGVKTPTTSTGPVSSRADEIRKLAQQATVEANPIESATKSGIIGGTGLGSNGLPVQKQGVDAKNNIVSNVAGGIKDLIHQTGERTGEIQRTSFNNLQKDVEGAASAFTQSNEDAKNGNMLKAYGNNAKALVKGGIGTTSDLIKFFLAPLSASVETGVKTNADALADTKPVQDVAFSKTGDAVQSAQNKLHEIAQQYPEAFKAIGDTLNVVMTGVGGAKVPEATELLSQGVSKDLSTMGNAVRPVMEEAGNIASDVGTLVNKVIPESKPPVVDEASILDRYNRAIRPTVAGKSNATQLARSQGQIVNGIKSIAENKANLELLDAEGNVLKGETPKTVDQLSQAISQTKKTIFEKYDALAKQAGEQGITVNAPEIAKELQPVIESKSLAIANPKAVEYAQNMMERLNKAGAIDANTAQDVIKHYNDSLKAFYKNPSYDTATNASIDAMIANKFREALDKGITGATGEQYQTLKSQYGALSSMEKDVTHRAVVSGRQNPVGLVGSLANLSSGVELVTGLLTMSPTKIASAGVIKGIQMYLRHLNNPDVGVSKIFSEIEKSSPSSKGSMSGSAGVNTKSESLPQSTTFQPKSKTGQAVKGFIEDPKAGLSVKNAGDANVKKFLASKPPHGLLKDMAAFVDMKALKTPPPYEGFVADIIEQFEKRGISLPKNESGLTKFFTDILDRTDYAELK